MEMGAGRGGWRVYGCSSGSSNRHASSRSMNTHSYDVRRQAKREDGWTYMETKIGGHALDHLALTARTVPVAPADTLWFDPLHRFGGVPPPMVLNLTSKQKRKGGKRARSAEDDDDNARKVAPLWTQDAWDNDVGEDGGFLYSTGRESEMRAYQDLYLGVWRLLKPTTPLAASAVTKGFRTAMTAVAPSSLLGGPLSSVEEMASMAPGIAIEAGGVDYEGEGGKEVVVTAAAAGAGDGGCGGAHGRPGGLAANASASMGAAVLLAGLVKLGLLSLKEREALVRDAEVTERGRFGGGAGDDMRLRKALQLLEHGAATASAGPQPHLAMAQGGWNAKLRHAQAGSRLKKYELVRALGAGSHGSTMLVRVKGSSRGGGGGDLRVLKESQALQEAVNEAKLLSLVQFACADKHKAATRDGPSSPSGVVRIYDFWMEYIASFPVAYLEMEYAPGGTLADLILRQPEGVPVTSVLDLAQELCEGLESLHAVNIIHRDIKPENILLREETGGGGRTYGVMLADLGVSTRVTSSRPHTTSAAGSLPFTAPEVRLYYQGLPVSYGTAADIWNFGAVLYCLVFSVSAPVELGTVPVARLKARLLERTRHEGVSALIASALQADSNKRPTARLLKQQLRLLRREFTKQDPGALLSGERADVPHSSLSKL